MSVKVRAYVITISVVGAALLLMSVFQWKSSDAVRYATYLGITLIASTLKVKVARNQRYVGLNRHALAQTWATAVLTPSGAVRVMPASSSAWVQSLNGQLQMVGPYSVLAGFPAVGDTSAAWGSSGGSSTTKGSSRAWGSSVLDAGER
jgi:hypothetical protein